MASIPRMRRFIIRIFATPGLKTPRCQRDAIVMFDPSLESDSRNPTTRDTQAGRIWPSILTPSDAIPQEEWFSEGKIIATDGTRKKHGEDSLSSRVGSAA